LEIEEEDLKIEFILGENASELFKIFDQERNKKIKKG
jgi:hypothetical protein